MPSYFFHIGIDLANLSLAPPRWELPSRMPAHYQDFSIPAEHQVDTLTSRAGTHPSITEPARPGKPPEGVDDWRLNKLTMQHISMPGPQDARNGPKSVSLSDGIGASGPSGFATKGCLEPLDSTTELGWGIVRLYRDSDETPGLYDDPQPSKASKHGRSAARTTHTKKPSSTGKADGYDQPFQDEDCTTLCILAVPSYMNPSDFLGFVGEKTREDVSHFRMIRTERSNRYMVLMKFRNGRRAREWRKDWNGRVFNDMEPEHCHVVFIKSVEFRQLESPITDEGSFPDMRHDPFTPSKSAAPAPTTASFNTKPKAPPTPALVELPTCPVCLERMDESTGLLTILCQHVFHCTCLQKWRGSGCPVCRYTQDPSLSRRIPLSTGSPTGAIDDETGAALNECRTCRADANLWICLICGNVGCGRYDAAHAFAHHNDSGHRFAMDLTTQRVWDYEADGYVHRILQSKPDGKLVELPHANDTAGMDAAASRSARDAFADDVVPREKMDAIAQDYAALLTSQLDSQRMYFEQQLVFASDKASAAAASAISAAEAASKAQAQLSALQARHSTLTESTVPELEKERDRVGRRSERFEGMARKLEKEWREEKSVTTSLMERIGFLEGQVNELQTGNEELKEENRDLKFFVSGGEKLQQLGLGEEVVEGSVSVAEKEAKGGKKGGKRAKKASTAGKASTPAESSSIKGPATVETKEGGGTNEPK